MTVQRLRPSLSGSPAPGSNDAAETRSAAAAPLVLSMVIPTRNEAENVAVLFDRTGAALASIDAEIIVVDDSDDATARIVGERQRRSRARIQLLHRPEHQRTGGLGGAVLAGMRSARAPWVCVMDADLQHPPELIPRLLERAQRDDVDLVIASRNVLGRQHHGLSRWRQFASDSFTLLARLMFRRSLRGVRDPMSGFFLVRRDALALDVLQPRGFKLLLEILVRHPDLRVAEVPFDFAERSAGTSKASAQEGFNYLLLVGRLWLQHSRARFLRLGAGRPKRWTSTP